MHCGDRWFATTGVLPAREDNSASNIKPSFFQFSSVQSGGPKLETAALTWEMEDHQCHVFALQRYDVDSICVVSRGQ